MANVIVTGSFSGAYSGTASAVTNAKGRAVVKASKRIEAAAQFGICVENLESVRGLECGVA